MILKETKSTLKPQLKIGVNENMIPMVKKLTMKIQMDIGLNKNTILRVTESTMKIQMERFETIDQSQVVKVRL